MNNENPAIALVEAYQASQSEIQGLKESLAEVRAMMAFEDRGWQNILGAWASGAHLEGLDLDEVQDIAAKVEPKMAAGSLPKRAVDLASGYVWGRGCFIEGTEKPKGRGATPAIRKFFVDQVNQESVFSDTAREELQKARFGTGNVIVTCNTKTKRVHRIPFKQITGIKVDPDFPENVIAYQRTWDTKDGTENSTKVRWYYTARFEGKRQKSFSTGGASVLVAEDETVVDLRANRQIGHVLGIPDALAGLLWSESYGRIITYGETVQESLASILFKVTSGSKQGVQNAGVKIAQFDGHGGTASMMAGQELSAVNTAGRGYDFGSARPVAAMAAAAWNVSTMDLLNDSAAAGSSYGSAQALVGGNRNAMLLMQREWADFYKSIFDTLGFGRPTIVFEPFEAPDKYRELQAITLGAVALSDEEYRLAVLDALDIVANASDIPETLKMRSQPQDTAAQQASPDQGVGNGTGGGGQGANDQRSDGIAEVMRQMQNDDFLSNLQGLVERLEAVGVVR